MLKCLTFIIFFFFRIQQRQNLKIKTENKNDKNKTKETFWHKHQKNRLKRNERLQKRILDPWVCEQCFSENERPDKFYIRLYCECQMVMCLDCFRDKVAKPNSIAFYRRIIDMKNYTSTETGKLIETPMPIETEICPNCSSWIPFVLPVNIVAPDHNIEHPEI